MSLPYGSIFTPRTTPLQVYQLVYHLIRQTFMELGDGHPFRMTTDAQTTGLVLDTSFNKESRAVGTRPLVIVTRGDVMASPQVLGDFAGQNEYTTNSLNTTLVDSSVMVRIITPEAAHTDILGNEIFNLMVSCRKLLPQFTSVLRVNGVSLSTVSPLGSADDQYFSIVSLAYTMQYKWRMLEPQQLLARIDATLTEPEGSNMHIISSLAPDLS
ncbi:MAG: hypothetical protein LHW56_01585 [Candidatus Cloacimonetes bacterium]|nr:hypothetical protein [Candidatus Cloacimonadota bacterium]MDY0171579.1 hypothetical protein [Candidatus Cloacimonadaceae bacterium]